ncbi:hypothetical protein ABPG72_021174 [Tetrahymena utriculariae]
MKNPFGSNKYFMDENINLTFENISKPQLLFNDNYFTQSNNIQWQNQSQGQLVENIKEIQNNIIPYNEMKFFQNLRNIQACFSFDFDKDQSKSLYIKTDQEFNRMLELLRNQGVICWDVHFNTYRSFYGFVCFLEISTIDQDYIIDCLSLRNEIHRLKEMFLDKQIVKITLDLQEKINWLYRDFGILNIVNSIDLSLYLKELNLPSIISYLCGTLLNYPFQKILQNFDYRKRPLSLNEINYLRAFSFFPLRILSILTNNILDIEKSKLEELFNKSQLASCLSLKQLENLLQDNLIEKHFEMFCIDRNYNDQQQYFLRKILKWRIQRAKLEDENVEYIFPACIIQKFISAYPSSSQQVLDELEKYEQEINLQHYETFYSFFDDDSYQNYKEKNRLKYDVKQQQQQTYQTQQIQSPPPKKMPSIQGSTNQTPQMQKENSQQQNQESPPLSPTSLLKAVNWVVKNPNHEGTPEKNYKKLISRQSLSPSILKYSPQNGVDSPQHDNIMKDLLCVINERNSKQSQVQFQQSIQRELSRINNMEDINDTEEEQQQKEDTFQMNLLNKLSSKQYYVKNSKENLPNNITDIFELANRKRKKNKDKKRKKEDKSPQFTAQKEQKEKEKLNIEKLLKDLNWI